MLYPPLLGRMLSHDNYVQSPFDSQSYNRYSYVLNNPLKYADPNGELYVIDDIIVAAVGFVVGYVGYGIRNGDFGSDAVVTGLIGAGIALLSYYTAGGFGLAAGGTSSTGTTFAANYAYAAYINSFLPGVSVPISENVSVSVSVGIGVSGAGLGVGYNFIGTYSDDDFSQSVSYGGGTGSTGGFTGWGVSTTYKNWGAGYHRTKYTGQNSQVVGGLTAYLGKNVSFRLENDMFYNAFVWGLYVLNGDTLKTQSVNHQSWPNPYWNIFEQWYLIENQKALVLLYSKNLLDGKESSIEPLLNETYYFKEGNFELESKPWLKNEKWFWCDESEYKKWKAGEVDE